MEVDRILNEQADAMREHELEMKKRLDEFRRVSRLSNPSWQECLTLTSFDPNQRREWATTVEADSQKQIKAKKLSQMFTHGVSKSYTHVLAKLLIQAATEAKVTLPKKVLLDLEKSGLPPKLAELVQERKTRT